MHFNAPASRKRLCSIKFLIGMSHNRSVPRHGHIGAAAAYHAAAANTRRDTAAALPHRFWTFSIPKAIRGIMLRDRRLLKLIPRCAFEALKQAVKEALLAPG